MEKCRNFLNITDRMTLLVLVNAVTMVKHLNHTVVKRNHGIKKFQESSIVINARGGRMLGIQILYLRNKMT